MITTEFYTATLRARQPTNDSGENADLSRLTGFAYPDRLHGT